MALCAAARLVEAAVRSAVRAKAPRRTTAAVAGAVARAVLGAASRAEPGKDADPLSLAAEAGRAAAAASGSPARAGETGAARRSARAARRRRKKERRAERARADGMDVSDADRTGRGAALHREEAPRTSAPDGAGVVASPSCLGPSGSKAPGENGGVAACAEDVAMATAVAGRAVARVPMSAEEEVSTFPELGARVVVTKEGFELEGMPGTVTELDDTGARVTIRVPDDWQMEFGLGSTMVMGIDDLKVLPKRSPIGKPGRRRPRR